MTESARVASRRFTEGPVRGHLIAMTLPMLWGIFASIAFSVTDTYFVSRLGSRALAAISFTFPVVLMFLNMAIGLGAGASSVLARSIGAGKHEESRQLASAAVFLSLLISLAFAAIGTSQDATGEYCRSLFIVILFSLGLSWFTAMTTTPSSRWSQNLARHR